MTEDTIPANWLKWASLPIDSPLWHDSEGEEYLDMSDYNWMVLNRKIGNSRLRFICRVKKIVRIGPVKKAL